VFEAERVQQPIGWDQWQQGVPTPSSFTAIAGDKVDLRREPVRETIYREPKNTVALWIFALSPIVHGALIWLAFDQFGDRTSTLVRYAILAGSIVAYVILAVVDHGTLLRRGIADPPYPALALLPPLYLIARFSRTKASSLAAGLTWVSVQIAAAVVLLIQVPALSQLGLDFAVESSASALAPVSSTPGAATNTALAAPYSADALATQLTPVGMADTIAFNFAAAGVTATGVACLPLSSTAIATQTRCFAMVSGSPTALVVEVVSGGTDRASFAVVQSNSGSPTPS
jgi:hypothetical protein